MCLAKTRESTRLRHWRNGPLTVKKNSGALESWGLKVLVDRFLRYLRVVRARKRTPQADTIQNEHGEGIGPPTHAVSKISKTAGNADRHYLTQYKYKRKN